jgi:hypothetical protein
MVLSWSLLVVCVVATVARAPALLDHPRLWAEEGSEFFRYAYEHSPLPALTFVHGGANYFVLSTNVLAVLAAHTVPLEWAPRVTTYGALAIQLIPLLIIVFGTSAVFRTLLHRVAGCAILLFATTMTGEVWLTSLHSQVFWGVAAVVICLERMDGIGPLRQWSYRGVLLVGALSSVYVLFLLPVLGMLALSRWKGLAQGQGRERRVQLAIVGVAFACQVVVALGFASTGSINTKRFASVNGDTVAFAAERQIAYPLLGRVLVTALANRSGDGVVGWSSLALLAGVAIAAFARRSRDRSTPSDPRIVLLLSFVCVFAGTCLTAFEGRPGGRYAVVPGFIVLVLCLTATLRDGPRWMTGAPALVLTFALLAGMSDYRRDPRLRCTGRTSHWRAEVGRWRQDPTHRISICPEPWTLALTPRAGDSRSSTRRSER